MMQKIHSFAKIWSTVVSIIGGQGGMINGSITFKEYFIDSVRI